MGVGKLDRKRRQAIKEYTCIIKQTPTVDNWSLILIGNSGKQTRTNTSELLSLMGKSAGVFIH